MDAIVSLSLCIGILYHVLQITFSYHVVVWNSVYIFRFFNVWNQNDSFLNYDTIFHVA
jgi:hypothetical protein